jgi:hypothetical protein
MMISIDEILQRIHSIPQCNSWSVLISPSDRNLDTLGELEEVLPSFLDVPVQFLTADRELDSLIKGLQSSNGYVVLWKFSEWEKLKWQKWDYDRSRLERPNGGLLLLTPESAVDLQRYAPNFASWVGTKMYDLELGTENLTDVEVQSRLETLQMQFNQTNDEVIRLAERRELPSELVYGEWLILLDRGDLIEH